MENKINIAELLKNCPSGMELDCTMYDDTFFYEITDDQIFPIRIKRIDGSIITLTKYGEYSNCPSSKCVIFPKGKTSWEGFVPPCPFKDGDIVFTYANCLKVGLGNTWISIFQEKRNGCVATYVDYAEDGDGFYSYNEDKALLCMEEDIMRQRFATEEERAKLFQAIKDNGYKWNEETKTLEKLVEPKFKVGDRIQSKNFIEERTIKICEEDGYWTTIDTWIRISDQDNWELIPNKFDISTLKPFESKVLVRAADNQFWRPAIWGVKHRDWDFCCVLGGEMWEQCIPYEGNEHLLGKSDDCTEFFKTWKY